MRKILSIGVIFISLLSALPLAISITYVKEAPQVECETEARVFEKETEAEAVTPADTEIAEIAAEETAAPETEISETGPFEETCPVLSYETDVIYEEEKHYAAVSGTKEAETAEPETEAPETEAPETEAPETAAEKESPATEYKGCDSETIKIYDCTADTYLTMTLGDYIVGVVAAEMPSRFELEALKAQAIACRTFTLYKASRSSYYHSSPHGEEGAHVCTSSGHCQAYLSYEKALVKWKTEKTAEEKFSKIKQAVLETSGIVAVYEGELIEALYHATSYGHTESAQNNWNGSPKPYLTGVTTPEALETAHVYSTDTYSSKEVISILKKYSSSLDLPEDKNEWFSITLNENGRVAKCEAGGVSLNGQQMRSAFSLASNSFTVKYDGEKDEFTFEVYGWGHGAGMSQYGAGIYADEGYDCEFIIKHYYTGVSLVFRENTVTV